MTSTLLLVAVMCGEPPTPPKPVVICYVTDSCPPCRQARRQLNDAAALPFAVEFRESAPAWVTVFPTFHWHTGERWVQVRGWHGLEATTRAVREAR